MTFENLRQSVRGEVLLPGDADFDTAAQPWNLAVTQRVGAVVTVADADDIAAALAAARAAGVPVVTQPTGHGATGDIDGAVLVRTGRFDGIEIDAEARIARVGSGARWGAIQKAAAAHGLTGLAGSNPVVGVTGYTLGGGAGWFARRYGWASDAVRAFEIVAADGRPARVTADSDPELFWALRGGGGDFAVVTGIEFELFPMPSVYGGRVLFPAERAEQVWETFQELTADAPAELSVWFQRVQIPNSPELVGLDLAYLGAVEQGRELVAAIDRLGGAVSDNRGPLSVDRIGEITAEPTDPSPALSHAELLTDLGAEVTKILVREPVAPLLNIQVRHLGGALATANPAGGARGPVAEPYLLYLLGLGLPQLRAAVSEKLRAVVDALGEHAPGRKPYTFLGAADTAAAAFDDAALARLRAVKRERDPHGVIRANFPVLG
ncbi:FAD-binding oxidoreductase [Nocardia otitidiscaviarum]|uniref:FAD-binding oxidoreductase n=1 Tax=Nocardia otitidiscaviarum TaxID=1823 RepID=A0A516NSV4_9NOCA|nr:FAD-binding oxidoreductase [Nocardia otitidiscaviarum]MCP9621255.1 FAD-binding oxidoreductase [Nocardia otitidiscaviarum]QDP81990.1 FAD-binding oxidoreductase [Nocardia otitidiscaviarum]